MSCVFTVPGSPTVPAFQPLLPGTTVAWTAHGNPSVPTFAPGKITSIPVSYYFVNFCDDNN